MTSLTEAIIPSVDGLMASVEKVEVPCTPRPHGPKEEGPEGPAGLGGHGAGRGQWSPQEAQARTGMPHERSGRWDREGPDEQS